MCMKSAEEGCVLKEQLREVRDVTIERGASRCPEGWTVINT